MKRLAIALAVLTAGLAVAQQSASYRLEESVLNLGGHPDAGAILTSASYRVTLDSLGEGMASIALAGASYRMDAGFALSYPPPGEVQALRFEDRRTLLWDPERSAIAYHLYRNDVCRPPALTDETATVPGTPEPGVLLSYLVTAENRLAEEGTPGRGSDGVERTNTEPCP